MAEKSPPLCRRGESTFPSEARGRLNCSSPRPDLAILQLFQLFFLAENNFQGYEHNVASSNDDFMHCVPFMHRASIRERVISRVMTRTRLSVTCSRLNIPRAKERRQDDVSVTGG